MTGLATLALLLAAWNPALFLERSPGAGPRRMLGWGIAAGLVLALAAATQPIIDLLDVSEPTFRTAAGAVIALVGARWLVGSPPRVDRGDELGHGMMDVTTPEIVAAAMAAATGGWGFSAFGVALAVAASMLLAASSSEGAWVPWLRRLLGGLAVGLGIFLVYAGIRSV